MHLLTGEDATGIKSKGTAVECILAVLRRRFQVEALALALALALVVMLLELVGLRGAEVRGRADNLEVGADKEATGDGGTNTSLSRFKISSGVISKSGVLRV